MKKWLTKNEFRVRNFKQGFTLIELLVAIAIIAVLSSSLFFILNPVEQFKKAHDAQRKNDFEQIRTALDTYYNDNNRYPDSLIEIAGYMPKVPNDPIGTSYCYQSDNGNSYILSTNLERTSDPQVIVPGVLCQSEEDIQSEEYNYAITSTNTSIIAYMIPPTPIIIPTLTVIPTPGFVWQLPFGSGESHATAIDNTGVYIVGCDSCESGGGYWKMEKRSLDNTSLIWQQTSNPSSYFDAAYGVAVDSSGLYVVGSNGTGKDYRWQIEKRNLNNGSLIWTKIINPAVGTESIDQATAVAVDDTGLYVVGEETLAYPWHSAWRIEKLNLDNGSRIWYVSESSESGGYQEIPYGVAVDSTGVYVVGYGYPPGGGSPETQIEKRNLNDGSRIWINYGGSASGMYEKIAINNSWAYVTRVFLGGWKIDKRSLTDGSLAWTKEYLGSGTKIWGITIDSNGFYAVGVEHTPDFYYYQWRIEKRDLSSGFLIWYINRYPTAGVSYIVEDVEVNSSGLYVAGYGRYKEWRVEKYGPI